MANFQALLDSLAESVFRVNRDGVIQEFFIPPKWEIGLNRKIVTGKSIWHYFPREIQEKWIQDWKEKIRKMETACLVFVMREDVVKPIEVRRFRVSTYGSLDG